MKILKVHLGRFRNEYHLEFISLTQRMISAKPQIVNIVANQMGPFNTIVELERKLVDIVRSSPYTEQLKETDKRLDRNIVGINAVIDAGLHHFDSASVAAAKKLHLRMKAFRGEIERKSYEEESAAVKILLTDLQTKYVDEVKLLELDGWVFQISDSQTRFEEIFIERNKEWSERPQDKLPEVRKKVDAIYRLMVDQIDAFGVINGYDVTGPFVNELNATITYFNDHNHRHAKKNIDKAFVNDIPDQIYIDEPAVPMPEVFYEDEKLVFTSDYELSYRDNRKPGTALVTIHGKGRFKGKKQISFNIVLP